MHHIVHPMLPGKLKFNLTLFFHLVLVGLSFGASAPPPNDLCSGAVVIPGGGPFPYLTAKVPDISGATSAGDPVLSASNPECYQTVSRGIWYKFTPTTAGFYVLSVNDTDTTVPDTFMALYTSDAGCSGPFTLVACNDDAGFNQSAIATNLSTRPYYLLVWKVATSAPLTGQTAVQLKISKPTIPANDLCSGAEVIPSAGPFPYLTSTTDTLLADTVGDPPDPPCQFAGFRSIWYQFAPATSGEYVFTTESYTATRVFDTLLGIYSSTGGCGGPFTAVACDDDAIGLRAAVKATMTAGKTYYLVIWDLEQADPGFNTVQLGIFQPKQPTVTTLPASSITSTDIVFNALITPNSSTELTRVWFDWGTTTNYGITTAPTTISSNLVNAAVSRPILVNPTPNATYHFRAGAGHSNGTNYGADQTFLWSNSRPHIDSIQPQASGPYRMVFAGNPAQAYRVEVSTTLTNWVDLGRATESANGSFEFIDLDAGLFQRSFYRIYAP